MTHEPMVQQGTRYTVEPHPHPSGPLLHVMDSKGNLIYRIIRKPITPTNYFLQPMSTTKLTFLQIKPKKLDATRWYTLYKKDNAQMSLRYFPFIGELQLRDHRQNTLAKFILLSPTHVQIRTSTQIIAYLRHTQYPAPLHFRIAYDGSSDASWLFAFLLYSVALVEETMIAHQTSKVHSSDAEKNDKSSQP